jgi:hypothetical protein
VVCALRFFYGVTLGRPEMPERIAYAREPRKLPVVGLNGFAVGGGVVEGCGLVYLLGCRDRVSWCLNSNGERP